MSKLISFWVLVAVIVILVIVFFRVMSSFILPLFLATVLVVIFNPLHKWILVKLNGRKRTAAAITTVLVMSIVLVPIGLLVTFAALEGRQLVQKADSAMLVVKLKEIRSRFGLNMPHAESLRELESRVQSAARRSLLESEVDSETAEYLAMDLEQVKRDAGNLAQKLDLVWPIDETATHSAEIETSAWFRFGSAFNSTKGRVDEISPGEVTDFSEVNKQLASLNHAFSEFKNELLGGSMRASLTELANPTAGEISQYADKAVRWGQDKIVVFGGATFEYIAKLIVGIVILVLAVYFFLLDGPGMLSSIKSLSPLDDAYEDELVQEFDRVSRAVVLAALLSAVVQGILAGFGYWIAGLGSVFLLTLLTMLFALIPLVGTSLVWVPCCLYLYLFEGRVTAAVLLAVFGIAVVSQIDNLIKPMVLHGQSKIHPLMALLSILGGVATLGPIGILVGPMVVAFLQTLLKILQREMTHLDSNPVPQSES